MTRSRVPDEDLIKQERLTRYKDFLIPAGSQIAGGELMSEKNGGQLWGMKLWDANKKVLIAVGFIDEYYYKEKESSQYPITKFEL